MLLPDNITLIKILLTFPLCYFLTNIIKILSNKIGFVNLPNPIVESHKSKTPYGGGIAIVVTLIIFLILQSAEFQIAFNFVWIIAAVSLAGLLDDILNFKPLNKFILQIASLIPFLFFLGNTPMLMIIFYSLIILSSQNAWNLIDVMDGLTAGVSFIIFLTTGILLLQINELTFYSTLSFAIAFSVLGFRILNRHPAKIFLGETGSLLLGSLFGFILIKTYTLSHFAALIILLSAIVPYFELIFLLIVRTKKRIPFYKGSPDHFALRMLNNGFSIRAINRFVMILCSINSLMIILTYNLFETVFTLIFCTLFSIGTIIAAFFYFQSLPVKTISR